MPLTQGALSTERTLSEKRLKQYENMGLPVT